MNIRIIFLCCMLVTVGQFGSMLYLPSFPKMSQELHVSHTLISASLTLYMLSFGISQLIFGTLSDHFGRKLIILVGLFLSVCACLLIILADNITFLLLLRVFEGLGVGGLTSVSRALINDIHEKKFVGKALGYTAIAVSLTSMIAPILGGFLATHFNWHSNFWFLCLYSSFNILLVFFLLKETRSLSARNSFSIKNIFSNLFFLLKEKHYMTYVLSGTLAYSCMAAYYVTSPFLFQIGLKFTASHYGFIFMATSIGFIAGSIFNNKLTGTNIKIMRLGLIILIIAILLFNLLILLGYFNAFSVLLPIVLLMVSVGVMYPRGMGAGVSPYKSIAGAAAALVGFFQMSLASIMVISMAFLPKSTPFALGILLFLLMILIIFLVLRLPKK